MKYPDHQTYRRLYAKYLDKRPASELVDLAGDLEDKTVVDLCSGEGEITRLCLERGAYRVYMVDSESDMMDLEPLYGFQVQPCVVDVGTWLCNFRQGGLPPFADVVFCRQAVNYWFMSETSRYLPSIMKSGGTFIFNTFHKKPSSKPTVKEYSCDGHEFVEVHWLVPDQNGSGLDFVHHVQIRDGLPCHATQFTWISHEEFHSRLLGMYFLTEEIVDGSTSIYICRKT